MTEHEWLKCKQRPASIGESVQPFPRAGALHANLNLGLSELREQVGDVPGQTYSYVMTTIYPGQSAELLPVLTSVRRYRRTCGNQPQRVRVNQGRPGVVFEQWGSGPNFQGGLVTLCTCKGQMRAGKAAGDWCGTWVAGFTSRTIHEGRTWLFYLARVQQPLPSQFDLWNYLTPEAQRAKSASLNRQGDAYVPVAGWDGTERFGAANYETPNENHVHRGFWKDDINKMYYGRQPYLFVFDPNMSFLWERPRIYFHKWHPRTKSWADLTELLSGLRAV